MPRPSCQRLNCTTRTEGRPDVFATSVSAFLCPPQARQVSVSMNSSAATRIRAHAASSSAVNTAANAYARRACSHPVPDDVSLHGNVRKEQLALGKVRLGHHRGVVWTGSES